MPLFDFKCTECDYVTDLIVAYEDRKIHMDCPECDKKNTLRYTNKIHKSSFQLKGTGWYETDHKHK